MVKLYKVLNLYLPGSVWEQFFMNLLISGKQRWNDWFRWK